MLRWPCLIIGIVFAVLFLLFLVTCRVTGLPVSPPVSLVLPMDAHPTGSTLVADP